MPVPDFTAAYAYVSGRLQTELDPRLTYHSIHHTFDVLEAAERLGEMEGISAEEQLLLRSAALYHDIGYIESLERNEPIAVRIAAETLPGFGYSPGQIAVIDGLIMATQIPQQPQTHLQAILCDADLDSLGREDMLIRSHTLRLEWSHFGRHYTLRGWYETQIALLEGHHYFTASARTLRDDMKRRHVQEIRDLLGC